MRRKSRKYRTKKNPKIFEQANAKKDAAALVEEASAHQETGGPWVQYIRSGPLGARGVHESVLSVPSALSLSCLSPPSCVLKRLCSFFLFTFMYPTPQEVFESGCPGDPRLPPAKTGRSNFFFIFFPHVFLRGFSSMLTPFSAPVLMILCVFSITFPSMDFALICH